MRQICLHRTGLTFAVILTLVGNISSPIFAQNLECAKNPIEIYETTKDKVVEIFSIAVNPFKVYGRVSPRSGTGFFTDGGFILTNYHVIADAQQIAVFSDDDVWDVDVVGVDPSLDIAVLSPWRKVDEELRIEFAEGLPVIGQKAYTIGFPMHVGKTLSTGVVSGLSRVLAMTTSSWLSPYIQTDAAISPGNSGGPMLDECGRVIGMISAGIAERGAENLGFAIPAPVLQSVMNEIIETGKVSRPWHGLYGQMVTVPIRLMLGVPDEQWDEATGFLVETVEPGSAADRAGLQGGSWPVMWGGSEVLLGGDIITHVNGEKIERLEQALHVTRNLKPGDMVEIKYMRDGSDFEVSVEVEERPLLIEELNIYRNLDQ